ncbi:MAG: NAD-dependent epimerase/dehydratase family protein [Paracoccaceae bacterium]
MAKARPIIVTGADGRIGRLLRHLWRAPVYWLTRREWDILHDPPPDLPHGATWLDLSGVIRGDVAHNPALAQRVCAAASERGGRVIYMSSAAVYAGGGVEMDEAEMPQPSGDYGRSKLASEAIVRQFSGSTVLRLGNLAGADALFGVVRDVVTLDPVPGVFGGPVRSYIGPHVLAEVLLKLCQMPERVLPDILNVAQPGEIRMADLLTAAGLSWHFGPSRTDVLGRVVMSVQRLTDIANVPVAEPERIVADLHRLGGWPK